MASKIRHSRQFSNTVKSGGKVQNGEGGVIMEESEDTSMMNKEKLYDTQDPDIKFLEKYVEKHKIITETNGKQNEENKPQEIADVIETNEEDYIKDANNEDEELYNEFENPKQQTIKNIQRSIKSARPNSFTSKFGDTTKNTNSIDSLNSPLANAGLRPTTVPLSVVDEGLEKGTAGQKRVMYNHGMRTSKSAKGSAFSIIGRSARLCPRSPGGPRRYDDFYVGMNYTLSSASASKSNLKQVVSNKAINDSNQVKLYKTATTTKSLLSDEDIGNKTKQMQQINVITDPTIYNNSMPVPQIRPNTAITKKIPRNMPLVVLQERPMTAQVNSSASKAKTNAQINIMMARPSTSYVPTSYMRPYGSHKRPISAAINLSVNNRKEKTTRIDPMRTKAKYLKYLKELEKEAKEFVIEEDAGVIQTPEEQGQNTNKNKVLLGRTKKQRKVVRLKKSEKNLQMMSQDVVKPEIML